MNESIENAIEAKASYKSDFNKNHTLIRELTDAPSMHTPFVITFIFGPPIATLNVHILHRKNICTGNPANESIWPVPIPTDLLTECNKHRL